MRNSNAAVASAATPAWRAPMAQPRPRGVLSMPRADANPNQILADLQRGWEEFKAANDNNLKQRDTVIEDKLSKIDAALAAMQKDLDDRAAKEAAQALNGSGGKGYASNTPERRQYAEAFDDFFRTGKGAELLKAMAVKAQLNRQNDPDGGYVVTPEIEAAIDRVMSTSSAMRQLATVRTTGAATYKKRVGQGGASSGWVGENEDRSETDTPRLSELEFPAMMLYAEPEATEEMIEDADFDIGSWLASEVDIEFMEQDGAARIAGNGIKRPRGILSYDTVEDDNYAWGKIGYKVSGAAADITDADCLITLTGQLKQGFRPNASWLANRKTYSKLRKLKDGDGQYLWQPSLQLGMPASLDGYPTYTDDNMPDVGAGTFPIAFGDFKRGYLILDRRGVKVLRNPYKKPGYVSFYTTKRTGGGIQHFEAIKLLKISA